MQSKEQFMEMRGEDIPQFSEPTATQIYHSKINEVYLMIGGCYNYKGNLLNVVKYDLKCGVFRLFCKHYLDSNGNYTYQTRIELESLRELVPCTHDEERLLLSSCTGDAIGDWLNMSYDQYAWNITKKKFKRVEKPIKSKAYFEAIEELSKPKEEKVREVVDQEQKHFIDEDWKEKLQKSYKKFKKP